MAYDDEKPEKPADNSSDLKEIREEYAYATAEKRHIREEGDEDMIALAKGVWHTKENRKDRDAREDLNRPIIDADELSQYVNQCVNDVRANKRSIRVAAAGGKATKKTAEFRRNLIRQIEYRSDAALHAYPIMFENAVQRSYGYLRIKPDWVNHESFDQELRILGVPNPNMVTEDPQFLRPDGADWKFLYYAESYTKADFKRTFGRKAACVDFEAHHMQTAHDWVHADRVLVAERWTVVTKPRKLLLVQMPAPVDPITGQSSAPPMPVAVFDDELDLAKLPKGAKVVRSREVDYPSVRQQIVNGVEILDTKEYPKVQSIPFVACYGKIMYVNEGAGDKKHILSLPRLARSPQMLYCYYRTQQAEMAAQIPKTPIGGYEGQFAGKERDFQRLPHEPLAYVEYKFTAPNWNPTWGPMPPPSRIQIDQGSHLQALELCAEGARRAIQAAMGVSPLPTQAQRRNEKSGVALEHMEDSAQRGSFHFTDHFDAAVVRTGQILDEWIPETYDAARDVVVRNVKDEPIQVRINDPEDAKSVSAVEGVHDITMSVGPRELSERGAASDFADSVLESTIMQIAGPEKAAKLAAKAIRLRDVGPIGDEMADLLDPPQPEGEEVTPEMAAQAIAENQQLKQQLQQAMQALDDQRAKEQAKQEGAIAVQELRNEGAATVAEINASARAGSTAIQDETKRHEGSAGRVHESIEKEKDRQHETALTAAKVATAADAAERDHGRSLESGDLAHRQALEQAERKAALTPPKESR